jgi:hypothetical protein
MHAPVTNSNREGARPSRFAMAAMDFTICCWLGMGVEGGLRTHGTAVAATLQA